MSCPQQIAEQSSSSRIYGRNDLKDGFLTKIQVPTEPVLDRIGKIYRRVNIDNKELLLPIPNGFCFGLLDPAANIVANGFIMAPAMGEITGGERHQALFGSSSLDRNEAQSDWNKMTQNEICFLENLLFGYRLDGIKIGNRTKPQSDGEMEQRSLDGLVAFLTYLFPYLPEAEATAYLDAANADPLVADHLIVIRRGLRDFCLYNNTVAVETALRCAAAAAARHPVNDPEQFVLGWRQLSTDLNGLDSQLSSATPNYRHIDRLMRDSGTSTAPPALDLKTPWELARARLAQLCPPGSGKELPPARAAMKRLLLATIHGFYLKALGTIPTNELCARYHRSIVMGGYCYGPLDPVSNIVVNSVWFDLTLPGGNNKHGKLEMISTKCLWRLVARSLYGLVSFLCTRYPCLTPDLALQRLLMSGADLRAADPYLLMGGPPHSNTGSNNNNVVNASVIPSTSVAEAYAAAATAAFHPCPLAQQEFLGSSNVRDKLLELAELRPIKTRECLVS
ncbi:hypothetical protein PR202_gb17978 [Eleusine coracana subsp. coracana]|uniref:PIR2-like helical domain-containing protein n=1 Tax=Eleusine coracana subsp. coracana TaxID=191504 RepID=A0AAV5F4G5_ELECO|nr:hypothetical protein PR202_gb17978 [Eleusine coracana subsp. coracana]